MDLNSVMINVSKIAKRIFKMDWICWSCGKVHSTYKEKAECGCEDSEV